MLSETTCPSCGASVAPDWRHCGSCGASLDAAADAPAAVEPVAATTPWWRRTTVIENPAVFLGTMILVLLLTAAAAIVAERRVDDKQTELDGARRSLRDTETVLTAVRAELDERVRERDAVRAELDKTKSSLTDAERSVKSQGEQLATFKNCLSAIEEVSLALDRGDNAAARAAAERADRHCTEALTLL